MDPTLPEDIRQLCASLGRFIEKELVPKETAAGSDFTFESNRELVDWTRRRSVELDFFGAFMPEEVGGGGLGALAVAALKEQVARSGSRLAHCVLGDFDGPSPSGMIVGKLIVQAAGKKITGVKFQPAHSP